MMRNSRKQEGGLEGCRQRLGLNPRKSDFIWLIDRVGELEKCQEPGCKSGDKFFWRCNCGKRVCSSCVDSLSPNPNADPYCLTCCRDWARSLKEVKERDEARKAVEEIDDLSMNPPGLGTFAAICVITTKAITWVRGER